MKVLFRFLLISLLIFVSSSLFAQRDASDTLLIKRPRYLGLFFGTLQYMQAEQFLVDRPHDLELGPEVIKLKVENAFQLGFFFTHPFLHKMEWDVGFGVFSFKRQKIWEDVTALSTSNTPYIVSSHTWIDNKNLTVTEVRSYWSYNFLQRDNYSILIGAGGWLASNRMEAAQNPGSYGVEGNITAYYRYNKKSHVQIHLSPGWMQNGYYINATIAICYQGERTMRVHPAHYYVRTYDPED